MTSIAVAFASKFAGVVITPDDDRYDAARAIWNGMVAARPALIARCRTADDIVAAVSLTRDAGLPLAVRGGGHSAAGLSLCDGGVVIDLSLMRTVTVDPQRRIAIAEPGATWAGYDAATAAHGLASTGGLISTTGVAGLTLGGGIGWLQRKHGLACDNLSAAEVVTADGSAVRASSQENPHLLWGLRGGGGNFGIVSRFEFSLHPVSTVIGGLMMFPLDGGQRVLRAFGDWAAELPDEASMLAAVLTAPPEPFVPAEITGHKMVGVIGCWCGDLDEGAAVLEPLRSLKPAVDVFSPMPYPALQQMLDGAAPPGLRNYFRGGYAAELSNDLIDVMLGHGARIPSPMSAIHLHHMGGAVSRVRPADTAFSGRAAAYTYNLISTWTDPAEDGQHIGANRELAAQLAPLSQQGSYVNFLTDTAGDSNARVRAAYGDALYQRLARLKREFDPGNLFRANHNIRPAR
jgi:FAD/FMN-containing dehydrogenase